MAIERIMQYECRVCGRKIDVTRTGDVYEEPVYCCGLEATEINAPQAPSARAAVPARKGPVEPRAGVRLAQKKTVTKKAATKKAATKKAVTKKAAKKKATKKKAVTKKAVKKAVKKKATKKRT